MPGWRDGDNETVRAMEGGTLSKHLISRGLSAQQPELLVTAPTL